ncbi:ketopantoate reductase family protein [Paenibacillus tarimensis]|uniref:ketopantoate reductase family protein n=1 Tax=Paenibacillus tarimensis TaxID=416012 RepID=UPI001F24819F|nr:2-dehydropantoate 2-reductase [Paenibacillus tarimensis]MCF2942101.1 2-dehydropantoate 2-reductase [Paenibacillus tarimensis]
MRFHIIGGGAIGLSYAGRLALAGSSVMVWTRTAAQAGMIEEKGISVQGSGVAAVAAVQAAAAAEFPSWVEADKRCTEECLLLTVKQTHLSNPALVRLIGELAAERYPVLCLQNGVGHIEYLQTELPDVTFIPAVTTEGAFRQDGRTVLLTGHGELHMGESEDIEWQKMLLNTLNEAGIAAFMSKDINNRIYRKLMVNAVINPLTALLGVRNGELKQQPGVPALMKALHEETKAVLQAAGLPETGQEWEELLTVCEKTADNRSSMLADIQHGRQTEIAAINGGVVGLAGKLGIAAPLNEALVDLVEAVVEQSGKGRSADGDDTG